MLPLHTGCQVFPVQPFVLFGAASERVMFLLVKLKAGIICGDERLGAVGRAVQLVLAVVMTVVWVFFNEKLLTKAFNTGYKRNDR